MPHSQLTAHAILARAALRLRRRMLDQRLLLGREDVEVALTSQLMLDLRKHGSGSVTVAWPDGPEYMHGADIELWIVCGGFRIGFRLQAKALKPRAHSHGMYDELDHVVGRRGPNPRAQVDVLLDGTPAPLNPGYLFYNGLPAEPFCESACCRDDEWSKRNGRLGLTFTTAAHVKNALQDSSNPKRFDTILSRSVPLPCLATCVGPTDAQLTALLDLIDGFAPPTGSLLTDLYDRMPGWIVDALGQADPLWVVTRDDQAGELAQELLNRLGVTIRVSNDDSTSYVELVNELDWPTGLREQLPGRELRGPLVVVDVS